MKKTFILPLFLFILFSACKKQQLEPSPKSIISFSITTINGILVSILEDKKLIEIQVPFGTKLTELKPVLGISVGASVVPASGVMRDFSKEVYYTVTGADGSKVIYQVKVIIGAEPLAEILSMSHDTIEAGQMMIMKVKNLSRFPSEVQTDLISSTNQFITLPNKLLDSTAVQMLIPSAIKPQLYKLQITNKNKIIVSQKVILVQYQSPIFTSVSTKNVLQGDTLLLKGKFLNPAHNFEILLNQKKISINTIKIMTDSLLCILPNNLKAGIYKVQLRNKTENKLSQEPIDIQVYDKEKPFVRKLINPKFLYKSVDSLIWKVQNFDKLATRFYQLQLQSSNQLYVINAQYDAIKKQMNIILPANTKAGTYKVNLLFIASSGENLYEIELNDLIKI